ncbi:unnamed protein product [Ceratitis capitata]|uniref:(Mediterranean fruit fly) hypothetical protein n=1 Tax=Ceratitis capitata TaxID=7213 RepID=A0A811UC40_CERCA|nr:unnamed protein product [Ceratitis capitata]
MKRASQIIPTALYELQKVEGQIGFEQFGQSHNTMRIGGSILQRTLCHLVAQALLLLLLFSTATANSINSTNSKTNRTSAEPTLVPTQIVSRTFPFVAKGVKSELVQKFIAPRHNDTENYAQYHIILLALVPTIEPDRNNDCFMAKLLPALELGIAMTQQMGFYKSYIDFTLIARDSFCSSIYGPIGFYEVLLQQPNLNAIFGLPCEYVLAPISRYAGAYDIPVITTGGSASAFGKKAGNFPTLTRLRGTQGNNLGNAVFAIISEFNWTRTALIYESDNIDDKGYSVCFFCSYVIHEKLGSRSVMQQGFDRNTWNGTKITKMLTKLSKEVRRLSKLHIFRNYVIILGGSSTQKMNTLNSEKRIREGSIDLYDCKSTVRRKRESTNNCITLIDFTM